MQQRGVWSKFTALAAVSISLFSQLNPEGETPVVIDSTYAVVKQNFLEAVSSQNRQHVLEKLLTEAEVAAIKEKAQADLKQAVAKDLTGVLGSSKHEQERLYFELLKNSKESAIKKYTNYFGQLIDNLAYGQSVSSKDAKAKTEEHFLLDVRASKGNFNSELTTVPKALFDQHLKTLSGRASVAYQIYNPQTNTAQIKKKQQQIRFFLENPAIMAEAQKLLTKISELEKEWIGVWFMEKIDPLKVLTGTKAEIEAEAKKFNFVEWYENKELSQQDQQLAMSTYGLSLLWRKFAQNVLEKHDWGMQLKFFMKIYFPFIAPVIFGAATAGLFFEVMRLGRIEGENVCREIRKGIAIGFGIPVLGTLAIGTLLTLPLIAKFLINKWNSASDIHALLAKMSSLNNLTLELKDLLPSELFAETAVIDNYFEAANDRELGEMVKRLGSKTFASKAGFFTHFGRVIRTFKMLEEQKVKFGAVMNAVGKLDSLVAAAELLQQKIESGNDFCLVEIVDAAQPQFNCQGMWDVFIDPQVAKANDLILGKTTEQKACGVLVSGPNYGGKSVFLRGMITTALLAQSFGIAPAKSLTMTPFDCFDTYINVQDDPAAKESLFSAEMKRVESLLNSIEQAFKQGKKVFIVADELLTGTKPKYATALVRSIIQKVAAFDNVICIFASHFDGVINNAFADTKGFFKPMRVGAKVDEQGFYAGATYQVENGISGVDSALFVAKQKLSASHQDIVEQAKGILLAENAVQNR